MALFIPQTPTSGWLISMREFYTIIFIIILIVFTISYFIYKRYTNGVINEKLNNKKLTRDTQGNGIKKTNESSKKLKKVGNGKGVPKLLRWYLYITESDEITLYRNVKKIVVYGFAVNTLITLFVLGNACSTYDEYTKYDEVFAVYFFGHYTCVFLLMMVIVLYNGKIFKLYFRIIIKASFWFLLLSSVFLLIDVPDKSDICAESNVYILLPFLVYVILYMLYISIIVFITWIIRQGGCQIKSKITSISLIIEKVFNIWSKFVLVYFAMSTIWIAIVPESKEEISIFLVSIFVIISMIMFIWMSIKEKNKTKK